MKIPALLFVTMMSYQEQNVVEVKDILQSAYFDIVYRSQKEKLDYLKNNPFEVPLLRRVEFRTETEDFEFRRQEYAIRISPNSFGERKFNKKYYESSVRINGIRNREALNEALSIRYGQVVKLIKTSRIISIKQRLELLLEDRINVLTQSQNSVDFDYNDLLDAEDDYLKVQLDLIDLEKKDQRLRTEINQFLDLQKPFKLDTTGMIDVNFIEIFINTISFEPYSANLAIAKGMENVVLAEYDLWDDGFTIISGRLIRTARKLADGNLYIPSSIWENQG